MDTERSYTSHSKTTMDDGAFPSSGTEYSTLPPTSYALYNPAESTLFDPSRLSPRSRAHSIASSVSSVASAASSFFGTPETSAGARPSLDFPPATLRPGCDGEGFSVEIPEAGQWSVSWEELVQLLLKPETTAQLPQDHLILQTAAFLSSRVQQTSSFYSDSGPIRPSTSLSLVDGSFNRLGLQEAGPYPATSADEHQRFSYHPPSASEHDPPLDESYYAPIPHTSSRRRVAPDPIQTAATFITPLQQAFVPTEAASAEDSAITPGLPRYAQQAEQAGYVLRPISSDQLPPLPPPPPSVFADQPSSSTLYTGQDNYGVPVTPSTLQKLPTPPPLLHEQEPLSLRPPSLAATRHLRTSSTSPYARRPPHVRQASFASVSSSSSSAAGQDYGAGSLSSRSSSVDLSSGEFGGGGGAADDGDYIPSISISSAPSTTNRKKAVPGKRTLRPLNRDLEVYLWSPKKGQLSRISPGMSAEEALRASGEEGAEVVSFGPGTYYKVIEDDLEILPCDGKNRVNAWLRGQTCVDLCSFRFEGKRPSVIRQHVVSCKVRANRLAGQDPLKRLCQLQLDAQSMEAKLRHVRAAPSFSRRSSAAFFADGRPLPPDPPPSATFINTTEDDFDRRSIASYESQRSASSSGMSFFSTAGPAGQEAASEELYWHGQASVESPYSQNESPHSASYAPAVIEVSEDVHYALMASSSTSAGFSSASAVPASEDTWLAGYGLSIPTGSSAAAASTSSSSSQRSSSQVFLQPASGDGEKMLVSPVSQSFLTMDE